MKPIGKRLQSRVTLVDFHMSAFVLSAIAIEIGVDICENELHNQNILVYGRAVDSAILSILAPIIRFSLSRRA